MKLFSLKKKKPQYKMMLQDISGEAERKEGA